MDLSDNVWTDLCHNYYLKATVLYPRPMPSILCSPFPSILSPATVGTPTLNSPIFTSNLLPSNVTTEQAYPFKVFRA